MAGGMILDTTPSAAPGARRFSILLSAYACEPGRGSEPGIGWHWATRLARAGHEVQVLTRANNRQAIESAVADDPVTNLRFAYCDLSPWMCRWKHYSGLLATLYYVLWQWQAYKVARRLCHESHFDVVHHITFGVFRHPSFMAFLGLPFIFGPVGGGETAPWRLRKTFPLRGRVIDLARDFANWVVRVDPLMAAVFKRSAATLCKTGETLRSIPARFRDKCLMQIEVGTDERPALPRRKPRDDARFRVLYVGRLVYWKGLQLGLTAFERFHRLHPGATLTVIGSGPDGAWMHELTRRLDIGEAVHWIPQMAHAAVLRAYADHDALLFPSLHDSSGNVVLEALSAGLPVVCLDAGGPAVLVDESCGFKVCPEEPRQVVEDLARALATLAANPVLAQALSEGARRRAREHFSWTLQVSRMEQLYLAVCAEPRAVADRAHTRMMRPVKCLLFLLVLAAALAAGKGLAAERYVDPAHPAARDAGEGDAKSPYRTLAHAIRRIQPGDTLKLAPGTYRDSLIFPDITWSGAPTTVQPAAKGAEVVIKGSDLVTGWQQVERGLYVKRPWTSNSQQVFVDGAPLKQIGGTVMNGFPEKAGHPMAKLHQGQGGIWPGRVPGGVRQMTENSFHYDASAQSLYVKIAPAGSLDDRTVEVSVRPYLALGRGLKGVNLIDLRFQHSNTTAVSQSGAISLAGDRMVIENVDVSHTDGAGIDITGDDNVVRNSRANHCGQVGMKVRGRGVKLIDNETSFNNTRGFNKWWEAGGAKFVGKGGLRDSEVRGHRAIGNNGDGIWFDWMNSNNKIHNNVSAFNAGFGIHYEASQKGYIYNNYVFGNRQRGIYLPHSAESIVAHNLVARNGMEGIAIVDEGRSSTKPELRPRANRVIGNIVAWNGKAAVVLPAELVDNTSNYNLYLSSREPPAFSLGWGSRESPVRKGLEAWRAASGQDANSWTRAFEIPRELLSSLEKRQSDTDWSEVIKLASRFSVLPAEPAGGNPGASIIQQLTPGPKP